MVDLSDYKVLVSGGELSSAEQKSIATNRRVDGDVVRQSYDLALSDDWYSRGMKNKWLGYKRSGR